MTREELDKRIDEVEGSIQDKIDYIDEWMFQIDMIDRWSYEDSTLHWLLHQKKLELSELLINGC